MKDKRWAGRNLLDFVPRPAIPFETGADGRIFLLKEKTRLRWLKRVIQRLGKSQHMRIHLDEFGSAAWLEADGRRTVGEIVARLRPRFGEAIEPAETRVSQFFVLLSHNGFAVLDPGTAQRTMEEGK
ncbi:MAG TPA: PqqD family protein [Candidatus Aminicenantes bacterium]|nr:PqqD family protein [Candidatus Aminicenantes bacterium]